MIGKSCHNISKLQVNHKLSYGSYKLDACYGTSFCKLRHNSCTCVATCVLHTRYLCLVCGEVQDCSDGTSQKG